MKITRLFNLRKRKIKEHTCPRCKAKIWWESDDKYKEDMKKTFLTCPICFAPYKINIDEEKNEITVEKLEQQVNIPIEIKHPNGDKWIAYEPSISDNDFKLLNQAVQLIELCKFRAFLDGFSGVGFYYGIDNFGVYVPPPSSDGFLETDFLDKASYIIVTLYHNYPFQVRQILRRYKKENLLGFVSTICPICKSVIPQSRIDNCPFCQKKRR